jgi:hypothetical protein
MLYLECISPCVGQALHIDQPLLQSYGHSIQPKQHQLMQQG